MESKRKDDPRNKKSERRCLGGCGELFTSNWIGNRICPKCKSTAKFKLGEVDIVKTEEYSF